MKVRLVASLVAAALLLATGAPRAERSAFSRFVVFGTSLSDSGNAFALAGGINTPPHYDMDFLLVPQVPYARGGHHTSNGATWIEQLARARGLAGTVRPAFAAPRSNATNFAVAAARAREDGINLNLSAQIDAFLASVGQAAPADALYVIEMGGNDVRDAIVAYSSGGDGGAILTAATASIAQDIQRLYLAGARQFLVWRTPNVGVTPAMQQLGPAAVGLATKLSLGFNAGLDATVAQLSALLPGINIMRLDAYTLVNDIVAFPATYELSNATEPCVIPETSPFFCQSPDEYLFWDGIHPTRAGHALVAAAAAAVLGLE